jgi:hypothetical protein
MSEDCHESNNTFPDHIMGCCKRCGFIYDLYFGLECPICKVSDLGWATTSPINPVERPSFQVAPAHHTPWWELHHVPEFQYSEELAPYPHVLNDSGTACARDCDACEWVQRKNVKAAEEKPELDWLEKLYALEDKRQ